MLHCLAAGLFGLLLTGPLGAEPPALKEPAYKSKPKYLQLHFGPEAKQRAWLVLDGDTLYVDRRGDGDLSQPDCKVAARSEKGRVPEEEGWGFEAGELRLGGKVHKGLSVGVVPLKSFAAREEIRAMPAVRDALKKDAATVVATLALDVESTRFKGAGVGGRIQQMAGPIDLDGVLQFGAKPADAPAVHFDGPLQITFYNSRPTFRAGRSADAVLVVGSPGRGPGTFAMLNYEDTIPEHVFPTLEVTYPGGKELFELKERC
ncbi:MAG: hypothetical protein ACJ8F7_10575 [Gemmataceae bacterium]